MAYQMAATTVTLNDLEGHSTLANVFKCNPSNIYAVFYTISTDSVLAPFLCISRASCFVCLHARHINGYVLASYYVWAIVHREQSEWSRLGRSKSSQVVSVPSRCRNFLLKSPPNFTIKVTTCSQNTVWTCKRQHASRSYILFKLVNSQFTSEQHYNYAIQLGSRPIVL